MFVTSMNMYVVKSVRQVSRRSLNDKKVDKNQTRIKRHLRVRNKVNGTAERPRLCVRRSSKHIYAQIIDDVEMRTLAAASSLDKELGLEHTGNKEAAKKSANSLQNVLLVTASRK